MDGLLFVMILFCIELFICQASMPTCFRNMTHLPPDLPRTCVDRYRVIPGHLYCANTPQTSSTTLQLPSRGDDYIAQRLNSIRSSVNPAAANMAQLTYLPVLQSYAETRVLQCNLNNIPWIERFRPGAYVAGETMLISRVSLNWSQVIDKWEEEKMYFRYNSSGNDINLVGNYSQIISARSTTVGCAANLCGTLYLYVCYFTPGMTDKDLSVPYVESTSGGSMCQNLTDSLCVCPKLTCLNGASLDVGVCQCRCISTVRSYTGNVCNLECKNNGDDPLCGITPYDIGNCTVNPEVMFHCPWMCNLCPYAGDGYKQGSVRLPWEVGLPDCDQTTTDQTSVTDKGVSATLQTMTSRHDHDTTIGLLNTSHKKPTNITSVLLQDIQNQWTSPTTQPGNSSINDFNKKDTPVRSKRCKWKRLKNKGTSVSDLSSNWYILVVLIVQCTWHSCTI